MLEVNAFQPDGPQYKDERTGQLDEFMGFSFDPFDDLREERCGEEYRKEDCLVVIDSWAAINLVIDCLRSSYASVVEGNEQDSNRDRKQRPKIDSALHFLL